jgi:hypothetical protein
MRRRSPERRGSGPKDETAGSKIETRLRDRAALYGTVLFGVALARFRKTIGTMA